MAAGPDELEQQQRSSGISTQHRLAPALSYPCLASTSTTIPTSSSAACTSGFIVQDESPTIPPVAAKKSSSSFSSSSSSSMEEDPDPAQPGSPRPSRSPSPICQVTTSSRETSLEKASAAAGVVHPQICSSLLQDQVSVEGGESGSAGSVRSSYDLPSRTSGQDSINGSKHQRVKRKSAWYQMLNPTYRSRCEDFKRIFKDLPVEERLIVDYSCALQRDILLQGRIYVTQNYLCFYANIFRWETLVQLRWKQVSSLTKEKTALVIPNAIQICTESDKHFFCSFGARDKTYVVLFRTWQQALLDQPLGNQELWKFVHSVYGGDLGFSSNEEGGTEERGSGNITGTAASSVDGSLLIPAGPQIIDINNSQSPSPSLHSAQTSNDDEYQFHRGQHRHHAAGSDWRSGAPIPSTTNPASAPSLPGTMTDVDGIQLRGGGSGGAVDGVAPPHFSDTSDSLEEDGRRLVADDVVTHCPIPHEGREMLTVVLPVGVDELFTLLFTNSSFFMDFLQNTRKSTDLQMGQWQEGGEDKAEKLRTFAYNLPLTMNIGVKTTRTVETQTLLDVSRAGEFYAVNADVCNSGVPYSDTFYVGCHYCITRQGYKQSRLVVHCQVKYRKSVWGIVKTFIEKNAWSGLEENFGQLKRNLQQAHPSRDAEERIERRAELPGSAGGSSLKHRPIRSQTRMRRRAGVVSKDLDMNGMEHKSRLAGESQVVVRAASTKQPGHLGKAAPSSSNAVLYVVFISLVLLVCTNGFLFSKIWALEELADQLAKNPPSCLSASNMADLRVLTAQPKSPEEWMRILRQQETIYRATESKWRKTLSTVSSSLKQTQESLDQLEAQQAEPDADLIRAILDKIQHKPSPMEPPIEAR